MDLAVLYPHSALRFPWCFSLDKAKLAGSIYSIKDGPMVSVSRNNMLGWNFLTLSIRSCEDKQNRAPRANSARDETRRINELENSKSSNGKTPKSPNQQEIIALIRRIRSSISKKKPTYAKKRTVNASDKKPRTRTPQLHQSKKRVKAYRADQKTMTKRQTIHKDEKGSHKISEAETNQSRPPARFMRKSPIPFPTPPRVKTVHTIQNDEKENHQVSRAETNLNRPPSSFLRKSPIPFQSPPRIKTVQKDENKSHQISKTETNLGRPPTSFTKKSPIPFPSPTRAKHGTNNIKSSNTTMKNEELELKRLKGMTLRELTELVKTRGIKGYSKLRKSELIELLRC